MNVGRHRCALVTLLVAALVGCGGDDDDGQQPSGEDRNGQSARKPPQGWPDPAETAEDGAARLIEAADAEDCSAPEEIFHRRALPPPRDCKRVLAKLETVDPSTVRAFGSGAVLRNEDGHPTILVLDRDGRYKHATTLAGDPPTVPVERADKTADQLGGVVFGADNFAGVCRPLLRISLRFGSRVEWCNAQIRRLYRVLGGTSATPTPLGGDGSVAFHGVRAYRRPYVTLVFVAHEGGRYLYVDSWPAGRSKFGK